MLVGPVKYAPPTKVLWRSCTHHVLHDSWNGCRCWGGSHVQRPYGGCRFGACPSLRKGGRRGGRRPSSQSCGGRRRGQRVPSRVCCGSEGVGAAGAWIGAGGRGQG